MSFCARGVPVFLTGMMGSGKSRVGRILATSLDRVFVDLDARIEHLFGRTVSELLVRGEAHFRRHERDALVSLLHEPGLAERAIVVATGGGCVIDPKNLDDMRRVGLTVYLEASPSVLVGRLAREPREARPLLGSGDRRDLESRLEQLLTRRRPRYDACEVTVDADAGPETVARRIQQLIEQREDHET